MQNVEVLYSFYLKHIRLWTFINWTNTWLVYYCANVIGVMLPNVFRPRLTISKWSTLPHITVI